MAKPGNIDDSEILADCAKLSAKVRQVFLDAMPLTEANRIALVMAGMDPDFLIDHMEHGAVMYSRRHREFLFVGQ